MKRRRKSLSARQWREFKQRIRLQLTFPLEHQCSSVHLVCISETWNPTSNLRKPRFWQHGVKHIGSGHAVCAKTSLLFLAYSPRVPPCQDSISPEPELEIRVWPCWQSLPLEESKIWRSARQKDCPILVRHLYSDSPKPTWHAIQLANRATVAERQSWNAAWADPLGHGLIFNQCCKCGDISIQGHCSPQV